MRRVLFGLLLFPLLAGGGVFAGDAPAPGSNPGDSSGKLSPSGSTHPAKNSKRVSKTQLDARSGMRSLALPATATYASEHSADLPISSAPRTAPPSNKNSWTGFYVGAGGGIARP